MTKPQEMNPLQTKFIVGLTGGIGSGKTVASDHFASLGVPIIDTDIIAREVVAPGQKTLQQLTEAFGDGILLKDGQLDRAALRNKAFASDKSKATLDAITHPAIGRATVEQIEKVDYPYCILVVPLLSADSPFIQFMQRILTVAANQQTKVERVQKRSQLSAEEVKRIMNTQLSDEQRAEFSDDVINNDGTIADAHARVEELHEFYLELSQTS